MASIIPVPTTRVGDFFVRQRLVSQVQNDQLALFKLQNQISSGQRLQLPSDDAPAALRAINLQRILDRKGQIETNIQASNLYLGSAEANLNTVSDLLIKLRADTIGIAGTLSNEEQRQTFVQQIDQAIETLVATGNARSQGRYLFSGSRSQDQPYGYSGEFVEYSGNEGVLRSYVDLERLFDTNLAGTDVFGGLSSQVKGTGVNPHLSADTLLSTLNGGSGVSRNAAVTLAINTGVSTVTSVVDLSNAVTLDDVARLIELGAPAGTEIVAGVTGTGLTLSTTSGTISVSEVAQGRAASELGILTPTGAAPTSTITGTSLNAAVLKTTQLNSLLGTKAQGLIESVNANNDILLTASSNGTEFNDVRVVFVNDGVAGAETADYDGSNPLNRTLTVHVQDGFSTATQVAAAITAEGTFTAAVDFHDATAAADAGTNPVEVKDFGQLTTGGSGETLDTGSGLIITNGGQTVTLDTSTVDTVEGLLNLINSAGLGLAAEINVARDGINVRSRLSGADLTIGENGGTLATQLGIRTYTGSTQLADFNRGVGVITNDVVDDTFAPITTADLLITARDGTALTVDLDTATTLSNVVTLINNAPGNQVGTTSVTASLTSDGRGIQLVDSSTPITGDLIVQGNVASETLGFLTTGAASIADNTVDGAGNYSLNSYRHSKADDLAIVARDGTELWIDLTGATTVQDVIDLVNDHPRNNDGTTAVLARLAATGNGIELVDTSTVTTGDLIVRAAEGSEAAQLLGFVPDDATQVSSNTGSGGSYSLTSEDRHTVESDSVFNTLIRLKHALEQNDTEEIGRSIDRLDTDISRVNFARSEIGSRLQSLEVIGTKLQDENVQLRSALSDDVDVDLVEAISNMTARQYALQASLQTGASMLQLSLLDFI